MKRLAAYKVDLLILAGFLLLPFLLFGSVTVGGRTMLPVDNLFQWAPWASAAADFQAAVPQNHLITDLIIENYAWKRFYCQFSFWRRTAVVESLPLCGRAVFSGRAAFGLLPV
ncbi:MAG: hypothetical protein IPH82_08220 [Chloroflexi bacterium]|nr:hypothetical protein [Chloroflexota bacterium]